MPEIANVVTGTAIASTWGNQIRDRTIQRYATAAARTASIPSPAEGDLSYLNDQDTVFVYTGAAWVPVGLSTEIDGYVEVATSAIGTSPAVEATVSLTIPTTWGSWKCAAWVSGNVDVSTAGVRIRIDGTDMQEAIGGAAGYFSVVARRTSLTTTGARDISLVARTAAGVGNVVDVALYARAVRLT